MSPSTLLALHDHYLLNKENDRPFNIFRMQSGGIINPARRHESLGKGGYGEVCAIKGPFTGSPWAVKFAPQQLGAPTKHSLALVQESKVLIGPLKEAPHTIKVKGVYRSSQKVEVVMERLRGPDLADLVNQNRHCITYKIWQNIARKALEAFQFYKEKKIVHADIKPENCFYNLAIDELTIFDFGNAFSPDIASGPIAFTLSSIAPERLMKCRSSYGIDIWALGIMLFKIYTGHGLFFDGSVDLDKQPMTKKDLLALMGEQFPDACPAHMRTLTLERRYHCTRAKIQETYPADYLKRKGMKYIPPFEKNIHPWYRESWQERIKQAAEEKNESENAKDIIGLLEKMFVFDDSRRLTPEEGLDILGKAHQKSPIFSASIQDPMAPRADFRSNSPKLEPMPELELETAFAKFLDLETSQAAAQGRVIFSASIQDPMAPRAGRRSPSPILDLMQALNLEDASEQFLGLEVSSAEI